MLLWCPQFGAHNAFWASCVPALVRTVGRTQRELGIVYYLKMMEWLLSLVRTLRQDQHVG
jgi:hypothetical protein